MSDRQMRRFAAELRRWAERPGSLTPPAARTRVLAGLPRRRRRPAWRLAAAGAALAVAVLAVMLTVGRHETPTTGVEKPSAAAEPAPRMIMHQLSTGTRLYIVMRPTVPGDEC